MIEHWFDKMNESIKQQAGVLELCLHDHAHSRYKTYCETVVLFYMFGSPRTGYDFGIGYINKAIEENIRLKLLINVRMEN